MWHRSRINHKKQSRLLQELHRTHRPGQMYSSKNSVDRDNVRLRSHHVAQKLDYSSETVEAAARSSLNINHSSDVWNRFGWHAKCKISDSPQANQHSTAPSVPCAMDAGVQSIVSPNLSNPRDARVCWTIDQRLCLELPSLDFRSVISSTTTIGCRNPSGNI